MKDEAHWRDELMKAIAAKEAIMEGRQVLVRMKDDGMTWQAAYEILLKMLREGDGILTEEEDDLLRDLADVPYGHCAPSFRVWP
ncbi:hypothetical protein [Roseimicrobium sp. ORNL1]|uniref:hypothetical protein n=1 Tax=Roseimicrobium sp. ORNL1 TaxID=2711231 RepID=UPI0013E0F791|nr:hypothetical protein [Roseimicrobium sp. ORNL1]QIF00066.1 hypothetical protein G5S37_00535 [Roseimicrobium sp. ORNL1]